jgi:hypothetical protein
MTKSQKQRSIPPTYRHDVNPERGGPDVRLTPLVSTLLWVIGALVIEGVVTHRWLFGLRNATGAACAILGSLAFFPGDWTARLDARYEAHLARRDERRAVIDAWPDRILLGGARFLSGQFVAGLAVTIAGLAVAVFSHHAGLLVAALGGVIAVASVVEYAPLYLVIAIWSQLKGDRLTGPVRYVGVAEAVRYAQASEATKKVALVLLVLTVVLSAIPQ